MYGGVEECGRLEGSSTGSARLVMTMQSLDQENPPYISADREFAGGGSINVLRMRDLADA